MEKKASLFLAIDQGTTSSRAIIYNENFETLSMGQKEFPQHFPRASWVEHDLEEIWQSVLSSIDEALSKLSGFTAKDIVALGITNQRETFGLWNRKTGAPAHPAIVWQCRRSEDICQSLKKKPAGKKIEKLTGLVLDPYFSGTKLHWLLENNSRISKEATSGELAFGTIDTYLVFKLTGGASHKTDVSNASRTLLMNLKTLEWDDFCLKTLGIPRAILPEICDSNAPFGHTQSFGKLPSGIPITGILGDQQAALFGQGCFKAGEAKCTYGTGAFLLSNTGSKILKRPGALSTVAWRISGKTSYALEGSVFIAGAAVGWLRDGLKLITKSSDVESLSKTADPSNEVFFIPALAGLGSPHWCAEARGLLGGLTRSTGAAEIANAALWGIAQSVADLCWVIAGKEKLSKIFKTLRVDGGAAKNNVLMQMQSDLLGIPVERALDLESTAKGAAMMAALGVGAKDTLGDLRLSLDKKIVPQISEKTRQTLRNKWKARVKLLVQLSKIK